MSVDEVKSSSAAAVMFQCGGALAWRAPLRHTTFALCETCAELGTSLAAAEPSAPSASASATLEHHSRTAECFDIFLTKKNVELRNLEIAPSYC